MRGWESSRMRCSWNSRTATYMVDATAMRRGENIAKEKD